MAHTKGPWTAHHSGYWSVWAGERPDNDVVCSLDGGFEANADANARLIEAEPKLLAALEGLAQWICDFASMLPDEQESDHPVRVAVETIRAAKGQA